MRLVVVVVMLLGCRSSAEPPASAETASGSASPSRSAKPPDQMDERMRHCPLALDGAASTLEDHEGGVTFTITVPPGAIDEVRRRSRHIVEFAARKTRAGHGEFDGKGGGRMRNCPVVTDDVEITVAETDGGARLTITTRGDVAALRSETRARVARFPFVGATITAAP